MMISKKALFGGALMAAGMTANAQVFNFQDSGMLPDGLGGYGTYPSLAYIADLTTGDYAVAYAPDSLSIGVSSNYLDLATTQSSNLLRIEGAWNGTPGGGPFGGDYGYGGGFLQQFFSPSADGDLVVSWDVTATDGFTSAFVLTTPDGTELFSFDGLNDPNSGSTSIPLTGGQDYVAILNFERGFFPYFEIANQTAFIQAELVPAPGAAGLLGLAGLGIARRRRS